MDELRTGAGVASLVYSFDGAEELLRKTIIAGSQLLSKLQQLQESTSRLAHQQASILANGADEMHNLKEEYTDAARQLADVVFECEADHKNTEGAFEVLSSTKKKFQLYEKLKGFDGVLKLASDEAQETATLVRRAKDKYMRQVRCYADLLGFSVTTASIDTLRDCMTFTFTRLNSDIPNVACTLVIQQTHGYYKLLNMQPYVESIIWLVDDLNRSKEWTIFLTRVRGQFQNFLTH